MNIRKLASLTASAATLFSVAAQSGGAAPANTATLAHETYGSGPEKILVLHSWMGDARSFNAIKPYLDTDLYTYVFADLRGYGQSRDIAGAYTAEEVSSDAIHLADQLGWMRFHVIGHSMSGMVVQRMLLDDVKRGKRRIKSAVAITPVTADGFPADDQTKKFRVYADSCGSKTGTHIKQLSIIPVLSSPHGRRKSGFIYLQGT